MKEDKKMFFVGCLLVSTLLGSLGQLFFKIGIDNSGMYAMGIYLVAGAVVYGIATLIYLFVLGRSHLSWTYGFVGFSYIFTALLAFFVLGEVIPPTRWLGVIVIAIGTALIGLS